MNILIIHEIDWIKKVIYEPHHLSELFSLQGHNVYAIDCRQPDSSNFLNGLKTSQISNFHRVYDKASVTLIQPPSLLLKGFNRMTNFISCKAVIEQVVKDHNIDIIFLYGVATNGIQTLDIAQKYNIPIIFRQLDVSHEFVHIPFLKQVTKVYEQKILKNCTRVYSCTPGLTRYAIEMGCPENNVEYFPLGVNTKIFKPMKKDSSLAKKIQHC